MFYLGKRRILEGIRVLGRAHPLTRKKKRRTKRSVRTCVSVCDIVNVLKCECAEKKPFI